jgi:uncharacterized protein YrrD
MIKSKKFIGMPVISLSEGQQIGKIKELVIDPNSKLVAALLVEQKGWFKDQKFIPYAKVCSVGDDAITIEQSTSIQKGASLPEILQLTKDKYQILDEKVVTESGRVLGLVEEYYVDISTGTIAGLEISGSFINSLMTGRAFLDTTLVRTIGKELIVTSNDAPDNLVKINGGFKETMKSIKSTSDNLWESTVSKTKELTSSINKKLAELKKEKESKETPCQCNECAPQSDNDPIIPEKAVSEAKEEKADTVDTATVTSENITDKTEEVIEAVVSEEVEKTNADANNDSDPNENKNS